MVAIYYPGKKQLEAVTEVCRKERRGIRMGGRDGTGRLGKERIRVIKGMEEGQDGERSVEREGVSDGKKDSDVFEEAK